MFNVLPKFFLTSFVNYCRYCPNIYLGTFETRTPPPYLCVDSVVILLRLLNLEKIVNGRITLEFNIL